VTVKTRPTTADSPRTRSALTRERIEQQALLLIEADGLDAFSTRKLGLALGCEAMSIYHHFPSKAHILDALVDRVLAGVTIPSRQLTPEQRLRELSQRWRQMARAHVRFYPWLALHRWNSRTGIAFLGEILVCFHDAGLAPEAAARGFRVLGYYILGATLDEISGYAQGPSALQPVSQDELEREHPLVAGAGRFFSPEQFDRTFELGLGVVLSGLGLSNTNVSGSSAASQTAHSGRKHRRAFT
jgi:AcrR family transcriptional regulator